MRLLTKTLCPSAVAPATLWNFKVDSGPTKFAHMMCRLTKIATILNVNAKKGTLVIKKMQNDEK